MQGGVVKKKWGGGVVKKKMGVGGVKKKGGDIFFGGDGWELERLKSQ